MEEYTTTTVDASEKHVVFGQSPAAHRLPGSLVLRALQRANTLHYQRLEHTPTAKGQLCKNMLRYLLQQGCSFYTMIETKKDPASKAAIKRKKRVAVSHIHVQAGLICETDMDTKPHELDKAVKLIESRCRGPRNEKYVEQNYDGKDPLSLDDHAVLYFSKETETFRRIESEQELRSLRKLDARNLLIVHSFPTEDKEKAVPVRKKLVVPGLIPPTAPVRPIKRKLSGDMDRKPPVREQKQPKVHELPRHPHTLVMNLHNVAETMHADATTLGQRRHEHEDDTSITLEDLEEEINSMKLLRAFSSIDDALSLPTLSPQPSSSSLPGIPPARMLTPRKSSSSWP